jgi:hypothetical protein
MLLPDWKRIAKKAWSFRLMAVAAFFAGCEAILPFVDDVLAPRPMAFVAFIVVVGAMLTRLLTQRNLDD